MFVNIYFYISLIILGCAEGYDRAFDPADSGSREDYVDPHSFFYSKHDQREVEKEVLPSGDTSSVQSKCNQLFSDCLSGNMRDIPDELFSRRLINRLLSLAKFEENDHLLVGNIVIELTSSELTRLKDFGMGKTTIREVDSIIVSIFKAPETNVFVDVYSVLYGASAQAYAFLWPHKEIVFAILLIVQLTWLLVNTRWTFLKLFFIFLLVVFIASFIITYFRLLKEAEIKLTAKQFRFHEIPAQCQPHKMTWMDKISSLFTSDQCVEYYEAMMEDHRFHVTPAQVLSRVVGTFILEPAGMIGKAFADFVDNSTHYMSRPVRWVFQPVLLIAIIGAVIVGIVFVFSGFVRSLAFMPISYLWNGGHQEASAIRRKDPREPIEVILNLKVSTDAKGQMAIAQDKNSAQMPAIKNSENLKTPKRIEHAGGDADRANFLAGGSQSSTDSSNIDDNDNEKVSGIREINLAGGDAESAPRCDYQKSKTHDSDL